jgi:hypothetical protein
VERWELDGNCGERSDQLRLHARRMEQKWWLDGSVGREMAGGRAAVPHAGPASERRLEALHTGGGCMCGAWKSGGRWQRSAGTALGSGRS